MIDCRTSNIRYFNRTWFRLSQSRLQPVSVVPLCVIVQREQEMPDIVFLRT